MSYEIYLYHPAVKIVELEEAPEGQRFSPASRRAIVAFLESRGFELDIEDDECREYLGQVEGATVQASLFKDEFSFSLSGMHPKRKQLDALRSLTELLAKEAKLQFYDPAG